MKNDTIPTIPCKINGTDCLIGEAPITYCVDFVGVGCEDSIQFTDSGPGVCNILPNNLVINGCCIYKFELV